MVRQEEQVIAIVGRNLARLRARRSMSRAEVAKRAPTCEAALESFEKGEQMPDYTTLLRLADALNVSVERIFDGLTIEPALAPGAPGPGDATPTRPKGRRR